MRTLVVSALAVALVLACASAQARMNCDGPSYAPAVWDDLSWWGNSGATPAPVPDPDGNRYGSAVKNGVQCSTDAVNKGARSGYWWYPTDPASNAGDAELWGNRGVIYAQYTPAPEVTGPPQGPTAETPKPVRTKPVYNNVLFDFDKAVLKPEGKAEADKVVADLKANAKDTIEIQGHTCDIGADDYNMGLGQRRADAVKKYLVEQGIEEARITAKSYGETTPAVANDSAANRKLNRRAVFETTIVE